jgi:hypothetical protein
VRSDLQRQRWLVHLWLIVSFVLSLAILIVHDAILVHILVGLLFGVLVIVHLGQRQRTVTSLLAKIRKIGSWLRPRGRMAWADFVLFFVTLNVIVSGFVDYYKGGRNVLVHLGFMRPFRWHAVSSILLLLLLVSHLISRWRRLRVSRVR